MSDLITLIQRFIEDGRKDTPISAPSIPVPPPNPPDPLPITLPTELPGVVKNLEPIDMKVSKIRISRD